jgi:hypothetical protein
MRKSDRLIWASVNIATGQCLLQAYPKGKGEHTIQYLKYLMSQGKRISKAIDKRVERHHHGGINKQRE